MNIIKSSEEAIEIRKVNINGKKNTKPWFTKEVKDLANEKRKAYLQYSMQRSTEEHTKYKTVRNRINNQIATLKKEYWAKFSTWNTTYTVARRESGK